MNIVISSIKVPFIKGGADYMVNGLKATLEKYGHNVELISFPFKFFPPKEIEKTINFCLEQDFSSFNGYKVDKVISLQFPAYYVKHPKKILWIMHQHRVAYELFDEISFSKEEKELYKKIHTLDNKLIPNAKKIYTISKNVQKRLKKYNNIESKHLYHPPYKAEKFYCGIQDDYIFYPSRLEKLKRQDLLIEAMRYVKSPLKALIAGNGSHFKQYKELIKKYNLENRVKLLGYITHEDKVKYYANSLAVVFIPYDEDYGYITLEAMLSSKPVITFNDSGAVLEFIEHEKNGLVSTPDPKELAKNIDYLYKYKNFAKELGLNSKKLYNERNISWYNVINKLLEEV